MPVAYRFDQCKHWSIQLFSLAEQEKMQIESTIPHQKSPVFDRRLAIFTFSLLPIHSSLSPTGDFWKVISNSE